MGEKDSRRAERTIRPDWGQFALVVVAIVVLALSAVVIPALGGVTFAGPGQLSAGDGEHDVPQLGDGASGGQTLDGAVGHSSDRSTIGGSVELSTEVQFTVRAEQGTYWRTGVYDRFTGDEWVRTGERSPYDGSIAEPRGERLTQVVTAETDLGLMPAAAEPVFVDDEQARHTEVSGHGQPHPTSPIREGDSYVVESTVHEPSPEELRTAGTDYPDSIDEFDYRQVPDDTSSEFVERTEAITEDADTPYEKATAIETHLRSSKDYSLDVDQPEGNVAEEFLLEMDEGYCVYFATTMTQMLRTEDVPARYVTGYTTGERVDDEYVVRGTNAHAWVEVYFPDHGWVTFEPTAGDDRDDAHSERLEEMDEDEFEDEHFEEESDDGHDDEESEDEHDEESEDDREDEDDRDESEDDREDDHEQEDEPEDEQESDDEETEDADEEETTDEELETETTYDIALDDPSPTPGSEVEVTVTNRNTGEPVEGAVVYFDDDRIGTTDVDGTVTGTVPYTESFTVQVEPTTTTTQGSLARGGPGAGLVSTATTQAAGSESAGTETTVETNAETTLEAPETAVPGAEVTITATVGDSSLVDGTVLVDGEERTTTDDTGTARVTMPETGGNATVSVERGEIGAERTIAIADGEIDVDSLVPLPGRTVDLELTHGGDPVDGATILVDGEEAATTANGTATVGLPIANEATIAGQFDGAAAETTVDGLYRNAGLLAVALVGGTGLAGRVLGRRYEITRETLRSLPAIARRLPRRAIELAQTLGRTVVDAVVRVAERLERVGDWCRSVARRFTDEGLAALAALHPLRLAALGLDAIYAIVDASRKRANALAALLGRGQPGPADGGGGDSQVVLTLRDLWRAFVQFVQPPNVRTKTPGEIGRYAVERGFPEPAVRTVVDAFRDTEYGQSTPSTDRVEQVGTALQSVAADSEQSGREVVERVGDDSARLIGETTPVADDDESDDDAEATQEPPAATDGNEADDRDETEDEGTTDG
ncbi:transglutaminase family protein [Natronobacterium texcoconense]|uniref:Transglutaminase-like superfamily protein n=1 Tax=Natronobacterium texcoconense TaxID=1095778 RepID=A0A1H1J3A1_NATTX|nr:Transglutaminase-like superfamily protein [Natronobacterium texcoconense]